MQLFFNKKRTYVLSLTHHTIINESAFHFQRKVLLAVRSDVEEHPHSEEEDGRHNRPQACAGCFRDSKVGSTPVTCSGFEELIYDSLCPCLHVLNNTLFHT